MNAVPVKQEMVSVEEAMRIIIGQVPALAPERVPLESAVNRILAEDITADRAFPPYDRVAMDGIAIRFAAYRAGTRSFRVTGLQAAGAAPLAVNADEDCLEVMTGGVLPTGADTVIRYEDLAISEGLATLMAVEIRSGQNVHSAGSDASEGTLLLPSGTPLHPSGISIAAAAGRASLWVVRNPKITIIATGDELVPVAATPERHQIRESNNYGLQAALAARGIPAQRMHLPDDPDRIYEALSQQLEAVDALILTGGVSAGRFDHVPAVLENLGIVPYFYKVRQKPGKPFWFGTRPDGKTVFAFPGNPVSSFLCLHRYFLPWLAACQGLSGPARYAVLTQDLEFRSPLQYFPLVRLHQDADGVTRATPLPGNGSGDMTSMLGADAFAELPPGPGRFAKGTVVPVWPIH